MAEIRDLLGTTRKFAVPLCEYLDRVAHNIDEYEATKRALDAGEDFELERSGEYAAVIINAMVTGEPARIVHGVPRGEQSGQQDNSQDGEGQSDSDQESMLGAQPEEMEGDASVDDGTESDDEAAVAVGDWRRAGYVADALLAKIDEIAAIVSRLQIQIARQLTQQIQGRSGGPVQIDHFVQIGIQLRQRRACRRGFSRSDFTLQ